MEGTLLTIGSDKLKSSLENIWHVHKVIDIEFEALNSGDFLPGIDLSQKPEKPRRSLVPSAYGVDLGNHCPLWSLRLLGTPGQSSFRA